MTPLAPEDTVADVRELTPLRCRELLEVATVGRIGYVSTAGLQIIPLSYRVSEGVLYLRTRPGSQVDQLAETGSTVAFEVDYHAPDSGAAWSVLMQGRLETLDPAASHLVDGLRLPAHPRPGRGCSRDLRFVPSTLTGRAITAHRP
jgi:nitroimidazol reductase NimA-like FMN-containing flavoprotein (pyridoxamine 5'-phosphate oxidase superfamily)